MGWQFQEGDSAVIGKGELEGRGQSAAQAMAVGAQSDPNPGLEEEMAGKSAAELVRSLREAEPAAARVGAAASSATECD